MSFFGWSSLVTDDGFDSKYKKSRCLGSGASGSVFLCTEIKTKTSVAVKEIFTGNAEWGDIKKEKLNLEMLNSPYIIKLIDHFESKEEKLYRLILEYCSGGSLKSMIGECNDKKLMVIALHILRGLDYMHSRGYIHRDIKPANLLCHYESNDDDEKKEAIYKLGDLGCSKNINDSIVKTYTGTIKFMAPEIQQMQNNKSYDEKVDIWSLGATLLCLGEGHNFDCSNPKFINIKDDILKDLICRCLIADPNKRYTANELLVCMNGIREHQRKMSLVSSLPKELSVWFKSFSKTVPIHFHQGLIEIISHLQMMQLHLCYAAFAHDMDIFADKQLVSALSFLLNLLKNLSNPQNKIKMLPKTDENIQSQLLSVEGIETLLKYVGWTLIESLYVYENVNDPKYLNAVIKILEMYIKYVQKKEIVQNMIENKPLEEEMSEMKLENDEDRLIKLIIYNFKSLKHSVPLIIQKHLERISALNIELVLVTHGPMDLTIKQLKLMKIFKYFDATSVVELTENDNSPTCVYEMKKTKNLKSEQILFIDYNEQNIQKAMSHCHTISVKELRRDYTKQIEKICELPSTRNLMLGMKGDGTIFFYNY